MQRKNGAKTGKPVGVLAVLLAIVLAAAVFPLHARADAIDLGKTCELTVTLPTQYTTLDATAAETLKVVVDIYQVAKAEAVIGYDTYSFAAAADFTALEADLKKLTEEEDTAAEAAFAESAAEIVKNASAITPVETGKALDAKIEVPAGLYLVLPHGEGLTKAEYFSEAEDGSIVTVAESDMYTYSFAPMLVSVPTKEADEEGRVLTSNAGDWVYSVRSELKPSMTQRYTSLEIRKQVNTYESRQPATSVFQITITNGTAEPVVRIEELVFSAAGLYTVTVQRIPVGAAVSVEEVYPGANYVPIRGVFESASYNPVNGIVTIPIPAIELENNGVTFINDYNNTDKGGGSVKNEFRSVESADGTYSWALRGVSDDGTVKTNWSVRDTQ